MRTQNCIYHALLTFLLLLPHLIYSFSRCDVIGAHRSRRVRTIDKDTSIHLCAAQNEKTADTTAVRIEQLKNEILTLSDEFKIMQAEMFRMEDEEKAKAKRQKRKKNRGEESKTADEQGEMEDGSNAKRKSSKAPERIGGLFGANSIGTTMVQLGDAGDKIISLAEDLAAYNPTEVPCYGWQGYKGGTPEECLLDGKWKLRFTSGSDATFRESPKRGKATTSQDVNANAGSLFICLLHIMSSYFLLYFPSVDFSIFDISLSRISSSSQER